MAALTEPRDTRSRNLKGWWTKVPMGAVKIYAGGAVGISSSGYAGPMADTTYTKYLGNAKDTIDNSGGSAGDKFIDVERGEHKYNNDGTNALTIAHVGPLLVGLVEWSDDNTAANATDTGSGVGGTVTQVESDGVWIESP